MIGRFFPDVIQRAELYQILSNWTASAFPAALEPLTLPYSRVGCLQQTMTCNGLQMNMKIF